MIAVDELPSSFRIVGVPATITPAGTQNMISLGLQERSNQRYVVESTEQTLAAVTAKEVVLEQQQEATMVPKKEPVKTGDGGVKESGRKEIEHVVAELLKAGEDVSKGSEKLGVSGDPGQVVDENKAERPTSQLVESWRKKVHTDTLVNDNRLIAATGAENAKNKDDEIDSAGKDSKSSHESPQQENLPSKAAYGGMGTRGTLGKKVYCTHWIRWGECDYTQQGCLYKHEMPDEDKLQEIGIATYPRWYRLANPEKFNGVTDGPEWHRRPGPAPTDQLWRGPAPSRPVETQTFEDFRSNARPGPSPVPRQPFSPPNHTSGPVIFAFDPNANTFHSFGSFGNFRSGYTQQAPRQSNRTPIPRVATIQPPFVRQQRPANASEQFTSGKSAHDLTPAGVSTAKVTEISEDAPTGSKFSPPKSSPSRAATTNGNHTTANFKVQQSRPQYAQGRQTLNEAYRPLTPSPAPSQSAAGNGGDAGSTAHNHYVPLPTPPMRHRKFFVPAGESPYVQNGGSEKQITNAEKGPKDVNRMTTNILVDV